MKKDAPAGHPVYRWLLAEFGRPVRGVLMVNPPGRRVDAMFDMEPAYLGFSAMPPAANDSEAA